MNSVQPRESSSEVASEDQVRAGIYALLARLFYAGPDSTLLAWIGAADETAVDRTGVPLALARHALAAAARTASPAASQQEYDELFVGTGRAAVTPYASFYLARSGREGLLVQLRGELAELKLVRAPSAREPEDHIAALCDVMRHLAERGSTATLIALQRDFFEHYLEHAYGPFCAAVAAHERSNFYRGVAKYAEAFFDVEAEALKMV